MFLRPLGDVCSASSKKPLRPSPNNWIHSKIKLLPYMMLAWWNVFNLINAVIVEWIRQQVCVRPSLDLKAVFSYLCLCVCVRSWQYWNSHFCQHRERDWLEKLEIWNTGMFWHESPSDTRTHARAHTPINRLSGYLDSAIIGNKQPSACLYVVLVDMRVLPRAKHEC